MIKLPLGGKKETNKQLVNKEIEQLHMALFKTKLTVSARYYMYLTKKKLQNFFTVAKNSTV